MDIRAALLLFMGLTFGFAGGFLLANGLNKSQLQELETKLAAQEKPSVNSPPEQQLTQEEIQERVAEADANPENFEYQRNLGIALYQYARAEQDPKLFADVERILSRAHALRPNDYNVLVGAAIVNFDIAQINKDPKANKKSQNLLTKALEMKPNNPDLLADRGATFFLLPPVDMDAANADLEKALEIDPKNERALQFMTAAKLKSGNIKETKVYLAKLKAVNPNNPAVPDVERKLQDGMNQ